MLVNITPYEAYKLVKNWDVARGWPMYAIMHVFEQEATKSTHSLNLHDILVYRTYYPTLTELMNEYPDSWEERVDEGYAMKVLKELGEEETDELGYRLEYIIENY